MCAFFMAYVTLHWMSRDVREEVALGLFATVWKGRAPEIL